MTLPQMEGAEREAFFQVHLFPGVKVVKGLFRNDHICWLPQGGLLDTACYIFGQTLRILKLYNLNVLLLEVSVKAFYLAIPLTLSFRSI